MLRKQLARELVEDVQCASLSQGVDEPCTLGELSEPHFVGRVVSHYDLRSLPCKLYQVSIFGAECYKELRFCLNRVDLNIIE